MEGMSKNISKQFGLLPLNVECKMFDSPSMLTPSSPAPMELLMSTSEMVTFIVCKKYNVTWDTFVDGILSKVSKS